MQATRLVLVGGFLGSGKTTTIGRLAELFSSKDLRVGIVTNDQATDLVDTRSLLRTGLEVREVSDACFCCAFPKLIDSLADLAAPHPLDVILGEPVGSCTDLAATVAQPLRRLYADRYLVTPLLVLVDPHRVRELMSAGAFRGFSPDVAYIFQKQLEEADVIGLNKVDLLKPKESDELAGWLAGRFPQASVVTFSARTGAGLDRLVAVLEQPRPSGQHITPVDYDIYAAGEAELGWLNGSLRLGRDTPFDLDALLLDLVGRLREALAEAGGTVAHLKAMAQADGRESIANWVRTDAAVELSRRASHAASRALLIVNARVALDPETLAQIVERVVRDWAKAHMLQATWETSRRFRPGRPVPTHRFAAAV